MAITSGTKLRARYQRPGDSEWKQFKNETTMSYNETTNTRSINHKDNPGNHDEAIVDGFGGNASLTFYHEDAETLSDLRAARLASEVITLQTTDGVAGHELTEQDVLITNITVTSTVRESVTAQVNLLFVAEATYTTFTA